MKLPSTFLLLAAVAPVVAQTAFAQSAAAKRAASRPAVHRVAASSSTACETGPVLPASVPKVTGCAKPLYELRYVDTVVGTGDILTARKWLTVNYTGYLTDGTKFDTSLGAGPDGKPHEPITFPYGAHQVITGWDTGFEGMHIGGKRRLFVPYQLAYGEAGRLPVIPAKAELVFDVELLAISDTPPPQKTPPTPAATPAPAAQPAPAAKPAPGAPPAPANQPAPDSTVGKPTLSPTPGSAKPDPSNTAPVDPTKPTSVPPKP